MPGEIAGAPLDVFAATSVSTCAETVAHAATTGYFAGCRALCHNCARAVLKSIGFDWVSDI